MSTAAPEREKPTERAVLFVDGSNWYHGLQSIGVREAELDYRKVSAKLLGPRDWAGLRWYVGRVDQSGDARLYANQRRYTTELQKQDPRISLHWGRIEKRTAQNEAASELETYLGGLKTRLEPRIYGALYDIARRHRNAIVRVEKAVDVMLAVDMVAMGIRNEFDAAYLLSADGDYTHAVSTVRALGKKVYVASATSGHELKQCCNSFLLLNSAWFSDCYR